MGVTGLWKLIEPCGKPVPVETLEGKILAVDISIWLHQVVKGFQDSKGSALQNAHLLGLFHRLCKLLFYRVRPIFVFDGCVPQLKRDTIERRQQQRNKLNNEAERIQALLLQSLAREKVVQEALGVEGTEHLIRSPIKRFGKNNKSDDVDDIFKLPEIPKASKEDANSSQQADSDGGHCHDSSGFSYNTDDYSTATASTDDSSFDEANPSRSYYSNLQAIDVRSQHFRNLPADVRHEILVDIKETRKQSSWGRLHELPSRSVEFSSFQMKRLLKRRAVQESLEEAEQEMGGRSLTYAELTNLFTEEGILQPAALEDKSKQIVSDENTRYLLVRDLKKKLAQGEELSIIKEEKPDLQMEKMDSRQEKGQFVAPPGKLEPKEEPNSELGDEYNSDLQLAIALSLEGDTSQVYSEKDYESLSTLRLNRDQRKELENAATGPARAFMIEYGGMNPEEVVDIMEKTQVNFDAELEKLYEGNIPEPIGQESKCNEDFHLSISEDDVDTNNKANSCEKNDPDSVAKKGQSTELQLQVAESDDTDSDLEEVPINSDPVVDMADPKRLEIVVDLTDPVKPEDDLFADVFNNDVVEISDNSEEIDKSAFVSKSSDPLCQPPSLATIPNKADTLNILNGLRKQIDEVKNIKLSDIACSPPCVEVLGDEKKIETKVESEVIEIIDSDVGARKAQVTATRTPTSKSPKTPTKTLSITEYFGTEYIIKRTPEKASADKDEECSPITTAPFFVNKSNKSKENGMTTSPAGSPVRTKASKVLFAEQTPEKTQTAEEIIKDAAEVLKEQKSAEELKELAADLAKERRNLETERNRQDRMSTSINQKMSMDCQELLCLFGIPYIVAPMEAEAQCAFLDAMEVTNGTITDDSDIWLFGGRTVYKNFFAQNKHVLEFRSDQIEKSFNCDRKKLIQLACLVGSDYTTGIHGIGAVTALEILAAFSGSKGATNQFGNDSAQNTVLSTLCKFRDWWMSCKSSTVPHGSSTRLALRKKLKNIELHEGFPNQAVAEAYLTPKVDENKEGFLWGKPDAESIREFTKKKFGWTRNKTDEILMPVLKKLNEKRTQSSIKNYFGVKSALSVRQLKISKRVQTAIERMTNGFDEDTPEKPQLKEPRKRTRKTRQICSIPNDTGEQKTEEACATGNTDETTSHFFTKKSKPTQTRSKRKQSDATMAIAMDNDDIPSGSSKMPKIVGERKVNIPNTKQPIPQVEKSLKEMLKNREKAIEIFKKSEGETKKKHKT